jgi:hypothetical protein
MRHFTPEAVTVNRHGAARSSRRTTGVKILKNRLSSAGLRRNEDVQKPLEKQWELTIDPDTVRLFVLKAKAISAALNHDYEAGGDHEIELDDETHDGHHHDGLAEEESEDLTERELRDLINDLNVDETAELIAMVWIGRGDFDIGEWGDAVTEARDRGHGRRASKYLLGMPMLGHWMEEGLEAVGA